MNCLQWSFKYAVRTAFPRKSPITEVTWFLSHSFAPLLCVLLISPKAGRHSRKQWFPLGKGPIQGAESQNSIKQGWWGKQGDNWWQKTQNRFSDNLIQILLRCNKCGYKSRDTQQFRYVLLLRYSYNNILLFLHFQLHFIFLLSFTTKCLLQPVFV